MTDGLAINLNTPCWLWQGPRDRLGYGRTSFAGVTQMVHRYFWTLMRGEIPADLEIDHLCRTRHCVNPQHMELVTHRENCGRATRLKTHCPHGHPYNAANTYLNAGGRWCRTCHAAAGRARRARDQKTKREERTT